MVFEEKPFQFVCELAKSWAYPLWAHLAFNSNEFLLLIKWIQISTRIEVNLCLAINFYDDYFQFQQDRSYKSISIVVLIDMLHFFIFELSKVDNHFFKHNIFHLLEDFCHMIKFIICFRKSGKSVHIFFIRIAHSPTRI